MKRFLRPGPAATDRGVTLVELLAALLLSAIVVVAASRIFLSGNFQFLKRTAESDRFEERYRLKGALQGNLKKYVERCATGALWIREGDSVKALAEILKPHFPGLKGSEFHCLELSSDGKSLVDWKDRFQPNLVEYKAFLEKKGTTDTLVGSWIK